MGVLLIATFHKHTELSATNSLTQPINTIA